VPQTAPNFKLKDVGLRASAGAIDKRTLIVGSGETDLPGKPVPGEMCMIAGPGAGDAAGQVKVGLGMDPTMTMNLPNAGAGVGPMTLSMYIFREPPGGRVAVAPTEFANPTAAKPITMVMVMSAEYSTAGMLAHIALKP
jgi:hypothetical protein